MWIWLYDSHQGKRLNSLSWLNFLKAAAKYNESHLCIFFAGKLSGSVLVTDSLVQWILFLWNRVKTVSIFQKLLQGSFNFLIFRGSIACPFKSGLIRPNYICQITENTDSTRYSLNIMFSCAMDITVINFFLPFLKLNFSFLNFIYEVLWLSKA